MATDVRVELPITRTRADIAAYMFDPRNDAEWTSGVIAVNPLTPGRLRVGSRVERTVKGGTVGLILDARGRPLVLPEERRACRETMSRWVRSLDLYP